MAREITCDKCGEKKMSEQGYKGVPVERLKKVERSGEVAKAEGVSNLVMEVITKDLCPKCIGELEENIRKCVGLFFGLADDKE